MFDENFRGIKEKCGVFGIYNHPQASQLAYFGLHSLQHRGEEGAGIVTKNGDDFRQVRGTGLLSEVFSNKEKLNYLNGTSAIGHVRYGTSGNDSVVNVQPFLFQFNDGNIALAHNGNLTNAQSFKLELEKQGAVFQSNSDTEILIHLIRRKQNLDFQEAVKASLRELQGGFAFVLLTQHGLIAALDPYGFRPLCLGKLNNSYVVASESCALDMIGAQFIRDVEPGEIIIINNEGIQSEYYTHHRQLAICSMEYIYFARPDSNIHGVNVHQARKRMGEYLAYEKPTDNADIVIGVPNSSLSAASGYAEAAGLPYEMGLIKSSYVARTFIQPTQELREQGVKLKLSALKAVVQGKKVVIVDDSIVRGTTSKRLIKLVRDAGATEVHLRIASPPLKFPCFYGIDISTRAELLAANYSHEEMCKFIGADSLEFLSIPSLIKAIGIKNQNDDPNGGLTVAYFNGKYPTKLYDYEAGYLTSLYKQLDRKEMLNE